jgi:hypothetical protein
MEGMGEANFKTLTVDSLWNSKKGEQGWFEDCIAYKLDTDGNTAKAIYKNADVACTQGGSTPVVGFMEDVEGLKFLFSKMTKTKSNEEFLSMMQDS